MAHKLWRGKECCDCEHPCKLDEQIPCSPDCENLNPNGSRKVAKCKAARCDAFLKTDIYKEANNEAKRKSGTGS
jgi:hypothetical protein